MRPGEEITGFLDSQNVQRRLDAAGIRPDISQQKVAHFQSCARALQMRNINCGVHAWHVPGRVEVLGKHTDYAGGRSLLIAADQGFCVLASRRDDNRVRVISAADAESVEFPIDPNLLPTLGQWSNYPMTVARRVAQNFPDAHRGVDIAFASDLPRAAGMSSSSAFIIATFLALSWANDLPGRSEYRDNITNNEDLAGYLGTVENGQSFGPLTGDKGVGTFGGSEDHTAILNAAPNQLKQYSFCPVAFEREIEMPQGYCFAIASSGVVAEKTGAALEKYNRASLLARAVTALWNRKTNSTDPHMAAIIRRVGVDRLREIIRNEAEGEFDPPMLLHRLEQFFIESEQIIPQVGDLLQKQDVRSIAHLVDRSQQFAEQFLGNQIDQTIFLSRSARDLGALASSAFGAGFGGSVWALINQNQTGDFLRTWSDAYSKCFPDQTKGASFFTTHPGPAAVEL